MASARPRQGDKIIPTTLDIVKFYIASRFDKNKPHVAKEPHLCQLLDFLADGKGEIELQLLEKYMLAIKAVSNRGIGFPPELLGYRCISRAVEDEIFCAVVGSMCKEVQALKDGYISWINISRAIEYVVQLSLECAQTKETVHRVDYLLDWCCELFYRGDTDNMYVEKWISEQGGWPTIIPYSESLAKIKGYESYLGEKFSHPLATQYPTCEIANTPQAPAQTYQVANQNKFIPAYQMPSYFAAPHSAVPAPHQLAMPTWPTTHQSYHNVHRPSFNVNSSSVPEPASKRGRYKQEGMPTTTSTQPLASRFMNPLLVPNLPQREYYPLNLDPPARPLMLPQPRLRAQQFPTFRPSTHSMAPLQDRTNPPHHIINPPVYRYGPPVHQPHVTPPPYQPNVNLSINLFNNRDHFRSNAEGAENYFEHHNGNRNLQPLPNRVKNETHPQNNGQVNK